MNGKRNEKVLAQERLHPAVFMVPAIVATVTGLPTLFGVLIVHVVSTESTTLMNQVMGQFTHQQSAPPPFYGYLYVLAFVPTIFATVPTFLVTFVAYLKSTVTLTNQRLTYRTGLISIISGELPLENVDAIFTEDHLLGRLFGFGTVIVTSVGGLRLPFRYIRSPQHFYQILNKAMIEAKSGGATGHGPSAVAEAAPVLQNDDSRYMPKA